jgi:L-lactate utilization protein LutB
MRKDEMQIKSETIQETLGKAVKKAQKVGGKLAQAVSETPEFIALKRNERAIKAEIDEHLQAIGKRVMALHKRAGDKVMFARYKAITEHLDSLDQLHKEFRTNRIRLNELREEIKGKKR